ncbi:MAG TPA: hypothetical protein VL283_05680 [Candidatus Baltobacteraceae bacterium]|nr:hypothetical protein [Candidatus Baltobacteraceae bacterium]
MSLRLIASLSLTVCACSGEAADRPTYACDGPKRIVVLARDEMRTTCFDDAGQPCPLVGIALPKGVSTRLMIGVYDDEKRECDPALTQASVDDEAFDLVNDGTDVYVTPLADVFDAGEFEPSATLTVTHGALRAQWGLVAMVDLAGTWEITVDDFTVGDFEATQSGRFIRWADCLPGDGRPECSSGLIFRKEAQLYSPLGNLTLSGTIAPTRDRLDGSWKSGGQSGVWHATKLPDGE